MRPATGFVIRQTGCGRLVGIVLICIGIIILLAYSGLLPNRVTRFWPVVVIAFGVWLLIRSYWNRFRNRRKVPDVIDVGDKLRIGKNRTSFTPPFFPILIIAFGVWRLVVNLKVTSTWDLVAIVLIAIGALFLATTIRTA